MVGSGLLNFFEFTQARLTLNILNTLLVFTLQPLVKFMRLHAEYSLTANFIFVSELNRCSFNDRLN